MDLEIYSKIKAEFDLSGIKPNELSPLILAHIGDAVYEVVIRTIELSKGNRPMQRLHKDTARFVNARAQAELIDKIMDLLTEEELTQYKRGRNAKSGSVAKNASVSDYRKATGFEALMGYLYLNNKNERMLELIKEGIKDAKE